MYLETYLNRFYGVYRTSQYSIYRKPSLSLYQGWLRVKKNKQKLYYILYFKLIRRQLRRLKSSSKNKFSWVQPKKITSNSQLILKLHYSLHDSNSKLPFSLKLNKLFDQKNTRTTYSIQRFRAFNSYEEKILDSKQVRLTEKKLDIFNAYKKIKKQVLKNI